MVHLASNPTIEQALLAPSFTQLEKTLGKPMIFSLVTKLFNELRLFFDMEIEMNRMIIWAETFCRLHPSLSIEDITIIFNNAIAGNYGKVYGKLNFPTISEWVKIHYEHIADAKEKQVHNNKFKLNKANEDLLLSFKGKIKTEGYETKVPDNLEKNTLGSRLKQVLGTDKP